jgi:hypothetical protein
MDSEVRLAEFDFDGHGSGKPCATLLWNAIASCAPIDNGCGRTKFAAVVRPTVAHGRMDVI